MPSRIFSLPIALALTAITVLAGCATAPPIDRTSALPEESAQTLTAENFAADIEPGAKPLPDGLTGIDLDGEEGAAYEPPKPEIQVGTGKFIDEEAARRRAPAPTGDGQVDFNFENNPIQAVVKAILGDLLQQNYTIAPNVGGNVSFSTSKPIRADQAMSVLEMLLSWTGNTLIYKDGRYTVLQINAALPGNLTPRISAPSLALGYEVRVFPLRYVSPSEMAKLLKPYAKPEAFINIDTARSMLVLAGTASELTNYAQTIEIFDVDWLKGMSIGVFTLQNVEVATLLPELEKVFGAAGESPLAGMFRFIPIERSNAIIAITAQPEYLRKAEDWLKRLDRAGGESATQLFVYDVKNIKSLDLADYLNQIFLGSSSGGGSGRSDTSGAVAPGLAAATIGAAASAGAANAKANSNALGSSSRLSTRIGGDSVNTRRIGAAAAAVAAVASDSNIRITAVEENNQLLVLATPFEWEAMQGAIRRLDIAPLQVHIETKILEVALTGNLEYGVKWWFAGLTGEGYPANAYETDPPGRYPYPNPLDRQRSLLGAAIAPVASGSNIFASYLNSKFQVALSALQKSGQAKVLSAPSLMVMNNQEAQINVGTRIPVATTSIVGVGGAVNGSNQTVQSGVSQTSYLDTGVILTVKPRVNPGGLVYMEVSQEVSKPGAAAAGANPPINTRTLDTNIAVQSGDTILLGGLISEDDQTTEDGVPGLSRIPVIGKLFGSTSTNNQRTELIVLITPQVMSNSEEARAITEEYKNQFQSLAPMRSEMNGSMNKNKQPQQ